MCHEYKFLSAYEATILLYQLQKEKGPLEAKLKEVQDQLQKEQETLEDKRKKWDQALKQKEMEIRNTNDQLCNEKQTLENVLKKSKMILKEKEASEAELNGACDQLQKEKEASQG